MNNANSTQKSTVIGMTLGFIGVLAFSLTLPMTQIALRELSPEQIAIWRAIYAALAAGVVLLVFRPERPRGIQFLPLIGCSLGTAFGFPIFISLAMQTVSASQGHNCCWPTSHGHSDIRSAYRQGKSRETVSGCSA